MNHDSIQWEVFLQNSLNFKPSFSVHSPWYGNMWLVKRLLRLFSYYLAANIQIKICLMQHAHIFFPMDYSRWFRCRVNFCEMHQILNISSYMYKVGCQYSKVARCVDFYASYGTQIVRPRIKVEKQDCLTDCYFSCTRCGPYFPRRFKLFVY